MTTRPKVFAYIDETGDRGYGGKKGTSPVFGMAAVLVTEEGAIALQAAVAKLRDDFDIPDGEPMSWKRHVKNHSKRIHAQRTLATVEDIKVCYVYAVKSALADGSYRDDPRRFYNYVAYKTYKSVLWAARNWQGSDARLWTRFGHVKHHNHKTTKDYIESETAWDPKLPTNMEQGLRWVSADKYAESQAADLYGGFLKAAIWPDDYGNVEPRYLLGIWHQIRMSEACAIPLGIMSMPKHQLLADQSWFPCVDCTKRSAR